MQSYIEFRIWDNKNQSWFRPAYGNDADNCIYIGVGGRLFYKRGLFMHYCEDIYPNRFVLSSYIGRLDLHGVKAFDGDIINIDVLNGKTATIEIFARGDSWVDYIPVVNGVGQSWEEWVDFEIIGNKWQGGISKQKEEEFPSIVYKSDSYKEKLKLMITINRGTNLNTKK